MRKLVLALGLLVSLVASANPGSPYLSFGWVPAGGGGGSPVYDNAAFHAATTSNTNTLAYSPVGTASGVGVWVYLDHSATGSVTGCTYGGAALTLETSVTVSAATPVRILYLFNSNGLTLATGTQNVVCTASVASGPADYLPMVVMTVTGGSTSTTFSHNNSATASTWNSALSCSGATGELGADAIIVRSSSGATIAVAGSNTQRVNSSAISGYMGASTIAGAATESFAWSIAYATPVWASICGSFH